ncbi:MAG: DUF4857 domain-containing protein [Phocaeicola sp.]
MKRFSSLFLVAIGVLLLLWQLPWIYSFLHSKQETPAFVIYSTLNEDFIFSSTLDGQRIHQDTQGERYSQHEVDSLVPFFYARQLLKDERFPDSIKGVATTYREAQQESFVWRSSPRDINTPQIGLYQLMESASKRVQLETPSDVFRITHQGIEFIDAASNQLDEAKSNAFTEVMKKKGFAFPATYLSGNPTVKKDYDQGYLILDSQQQLFHLKQVVGRAFVRKIELPQGIQLKNTFITEHRNQRTIGYASDSNNQFYVIELPSYAVKQLQIPSFNPEKEGLMIYGNQMDWTLKLMNSKKVTYYAINAYDYSLIKQYEEAYPEPNWLSKLFGAISLRFTSPMDKFVYPRIGN